MKHQYAANTSYWNLKMRKTLKTRTILAFLITAMIGTIVNGDTDFFTATDRVKELVDLEQKTIRIFKNFVQDAQEKLDKMKEYVDYQDYVHYYIGEDRQRYIENPVHSFLLLKRMVMYYKELERLAQEIYNINPVYSIRCLKNSHSFPTNEDFEGAAYGINVLVDTYQLNVSTLVKGNLVANGPYHPQAPIISDHREIQITAQDCVILSEAARNHDLVDVAVQWLKESLSAVEQGDVTVTKEEVMLHLNNAIYLQNQLQETQSSTGTAVTQANREAVLFDDSLDEDLKLQQYQRLCRGEKLRPPDMDKKLSCYYFKGYHSFFILQPVKLEELSLSPYIAVLYDVITDKEIHQIKKFSLPLLSRSYHHGTADSYVVSNRRTSSNSWLEDNNHPVAMKLNKRFEMLLNLDGDSLTAESEPYQITNYGIGGLYTVHPDFLAFRKDYITEINPFFADSGDRIATLMLYLTDVEAGGATVFPYIGVTAWPKKGSGLFWWNLRKDGEGNNMTWHGGCPVLHGSKWIANKWFRSNAQMFRKKCGLKENDEFVSI